MAGKSKRVLIRLNSTGQHPDGRKTGYFYTTQKNPKTEKKIWRKYDPVLRQVVDFKEGKIK